MAQNVVPLMRHSLVAPSDPARFNRPTSRLVGWVQLGRVMKLSLVLVLLLDIQPATAAVTVSPHFFGPTPTKSLTYGDGHTTVSYHNDYGSIYNDADNPYAFYTWKWPSTSTTWYSGLYKFDASFPAAWQSAVSAAMSSWNSQPYYSPYMSLTTGSTYDILFKYGNSSVCSGGVWYACAQLNTSSTATKAAAEADQSWIITLNSAWPYGVAQTGKFDVQSLALNELGHAEYLNHNHSWLDGTVQADSCYWGSTTCYDSIGRRVSCTNCGDRRVVLAGDQSTLNHNYGALPGHCPPVCTPAKAAGPPDTTATPNDQRTVAATIWVAN